MRKIIILKMLLSCLALGVQAQNVGIGTNTPDISAILDVSSTNSGVLIPRMSEAQRDSITNPAEGLWIYCTDCDTAGGVMQFYNGTLWENTGVSPIVGSGLFLELNQKPTLLFSPAYTAVNQIAFRKSEEILIAIN